MLLNTKGTFGKPANPQRMCIYGYTAVGISKTDFSPWYPQIDGFMYLQEQKVGWSRYATKQPAGYMALPNTGFSNPGDMQIHILEYVVSKCALNANCSLVAQRVIAYYEATSS